MSVFGCSSEATIVRSTILSLRYKESARFLFVSSVSNHTERNGGEEAKYAQNGGEVAALVLVIKCGPKMSGNASRG